MRKNVAIILAGGTGERSKLNTPKQFLKLAGKTVIEHTAIAFQQSIDIDEIAIVASSQYHEYIQEIMSSSHITKLKKILNNGAERYQSTLSAIKAYECEENINLIIHDAVRPLVSTRIIHDCVKALEKYKAVDTAIPSADTIIEISDHVLKNIPIREHFWKGQTPQCFHLETLKEAYEKALVDPNFQTTDDCKIVYTYCPDVKTHIVTGHESNVKLTYIEDIHILDRLFQLHTEDSSFYKEESLLELKDKNIVVFGGTEGIGKSIVDMANHNGLTIHSFSRRNGVNITKFEDIQKALQSINSPIDAVIISAGILHKEPLNSMNYDDIRAILDTNILGSLICAKEAYPYLKETKGSLILFTSSSYTKGRQFYAPYSASKAAIVNLTQALAEEWHNDEIRVNCINPERTQTPMRVKAFGIEDPSTLLSPEKVAEVTLHTLLRNFSGQIINVTKVKLTNTLNTIFGLLLIITSIITQK